MTMYLKTADEAAMIAALTPVLPDFIAPETDEDAGSPRFYTDQWALDWDIPIVSIPAVIDAEGEVITAAVMEDGFFANLKTTLDTSSIAGLDQVPTTPSRIFAGDN